MGHFVWLVLLVLSVATKCICERFHIVPINSTETCEVQPCLTLDQFAREEENQHFSNLTLLFTNGKHTLNQQLSISYTEHLKLVGTSLNSELWFQENRNILLISNIHFLDVLNMTLISSSSQGENKQIQIKKCGNFFLIGCNIQRVIFQVYTINKTISDCTFDGKQSGGTLA